MALSAISITRLRNIFGLPTLRGLLLAVVLGLALWFSLSRDSAVERWLFLLMSLLVLVHLLEASRPFRMTQLRILSYAPPFAGQPALIPLQIFNSTKVKIEALALRFRGGKEWVEVGVVEGNSATLAFLPTTFPNPGRHLLPAITVRNIPTPKFFRFWKIFQGEEVVFVLPKPVDHLISAGPRSVVHEDEELAELEPLRDPRHFPFADQKLLLKTGIPYRRVHRSRREGEQVELSWFHLEGLEPLQRAEQFSYWIQLYSGKKMASNFVVSIKTPFLVDARPSRAMDWGSLKFLFAKWLHAQS